jgi:methylated-DNA-[protein]-cysteine S-methyltransferase
MSDSDLMHTVVESPIGALLVVARADGLVAIRFDPTDVPQGSRAATDGVLGEAARQLHAYGRGERTTFALPLRPQRGGAFERRVWDLVAAVPYGATVTYGDLARRLGAPNAARAVGAANGANPLPIVVPCHRVLGARGALTGYAGGLERKRLLLEHEGALLATG